MTSSNHVTTGAVIALAARRPELAIPLAFISHYLLDMIPHFGMYESDVLKRNASRTFRTVLGVDICLMLTLLVLLPSLAAGKLAWGIVLASMLAAILPDTVWVYRFVNEVKTRQWQPGHWSTRFHQAIQWFEQPIGLVIEIGWLVAMLLIYSELVS